MRDSISEITRDCLEKQFAKGKKMRDKENEFGIKLLSAWVAITIIIWLAVATVGGLALIKLCSTYLWG